MLGQQLLDSVNFFKSLAPPIIGREYCAYLTYKSPEICSPFYISFTYIKFEALFFSSFGLQSLSISIIFSESILVMLCFHLAPLLT